MISRYSSFKTRAQKIQQCPFPSKLAPAYKIENYQVKLIILSTGFSLAQRNIQLRMRYSNMSWGGEEPAMPTPRWNKRTISSK